MNSVIKEALEYLKGLSDEDHRALIRSVLDDMGDADMEEAVVLGGVSGWLSESLEPNEESEPSVEDEPKAEGFVSRALRYLESLPEEEYDAFFAVDSGDLACDCYPICTCPEESDE